MLLFETNVGGRVSAIDTTPESREELETRRRILDSAERLFAERGFQATSVREITAEAGCNVAAVNYHFGGKEALYLETFRGLLADLRDRRIRRVQSEMEALAGRRTLETLLESIANAFLEPVVEGGRGGLLMGFMAHEFARRHLSPEVFIGEFIRPIVEVYVEELRRVVPSLDHASARLCIMSLIGQLVHVVKAHHLSGDADVGDLMPQDPAALVRHVVRFSVGGIGACTTAEHNQDQRSQMKDD